MRMRGKQMAAGVAALAVYALAANPEATGLAAHEWLGLALVVLVAAHCVCRFDLVAARVRMVGRSGRARAVLALDAATLLALAVCAVSGAAVSGAVLPTFGLYVPAGFFFWDPLHAASAKVLLVLVVAHVAVRVARLAKGRFGGAAQRTKGNASDGD